MLYEVITSIDDALNQIRAMDLDEISKKVQLTLKSIEQVMIDTNVKNISAKIEKSIDRAGQILDDKRWDSIMASVDEAGRSLNDIMNKTSSSLNHVEKTILQLEGITVEKEQSIKTAIEDFRRSMENANTLLKKGNFLTDKTDDSISQLKGQFLIIA